MKVEVRFCKGDKGKPLAVFIHGMGMNSDFWSDPTRARVLGGRYPINVLLSADTEMKTSFEDLRGLGFSVLTWTQSRPSGPINAAVRELRGILQEYPKQAGEGVFFICHSRGGLVARKYLEGPEKLTRALITISTPHRGTSMARWAVYISPLASAMTHLLDNFSRKEADTAFRKIAGFLGSSGLRELLPESNFYRELKDEKVRGVKYVSTGGTNPDLFRALAVPLPEMLAKVVPEKMFPEEMKDGRGDGLVSAESSVLPYADEHRNFPLNHASIIFNRRVRDFIVGTVQSIYS